MAKYRVYVFGDCARPSRIEEPECADDAEAINTMLDFAGMSPAELRRLDEFDETTVISWRGRSSRRPFARRCRLAENAAMRHEGPLDERR